MITAVFTDNSDYARATGLWQWNYGQKLRIEGLRLPTAVEIHFALTEQSGDAITRVGTTQDGVTEVVIPDSLLENQAAGATYEIYAWIYLADKTSGETIKRISMQVKRRPKPEGHDTPEDAELFRDAIAQVNASADRAETAREGAEAAKKAAEAAAGKIEGEITGAGQIAEQVKQDAAAVADDRSAVSQLATETTQNAQNAAEAAQAAERSSTAAKEAQTAAESAKAGATAAMEEVERDRVEVSETHKAVEQLREVVDTDRQAVAADRQAVENTALQFGQAAQSAINAVGQAQEAAVGAVSAEGQRQTTAVQQAGTQAVSDVETAKTEAVEAVTSEGDVQVGRVREAAAEIAADREQIQQNQADIAALTDKTNTLAPGIVLDARGKQMIISDASEQPFVGLNVYGKSTQVKTTGVNIANGMDNVYKKEQSEQQKQNYCWGYSLGGGPLILDKPLKAGTYTFSFYSDAIASVYLAKAPYVTGQFVQYPVNHKVTGDIKNGLQRYFCPFQLTDEKDLIGIYSDGYTTCFGGMINFGDKPLPYEPYTGGKPSPSPEYPQKIVSAGDNGALEVKVTDSDKKNQQLIIQMPNGLPGIPVNKDGNYIDENGQQWICDEVDLGRGKYVQRVKDIKLNGDTEISHGFHSNGNGYIGVSKIGAKKVNNLMSDRYIGGDWSAENGHFYVPDNKGIIVVDKRFTSLEEAKRIIGVEQPYFLYQLATPIERDLTPEELAAYKALHTNYPTTVITNDAGAHMEASYVADTGNYVRNMEERLNAKLVNIQSALISQKISGGV